MQSRANNQVDKNRDKAAQELWDATMRAIDRNGVVFVLALARYAGYGQKRLNDFLAVLNETMDEYHQHCLDGVFDIMAERELNSVGITIDQLLPPPLPFKLELQKSKRETAKHTDVDIFTAKKLQDKLHDYTNCIQL